MKASQLATISLVSLGALGFLVSIPGVWEQGRYWYLRAANGSSMTLDGQEYAVPPGWIVENVGPTRLGETYHLLQMEPPSGDRVSISKGAEEVDAIRATSTLIDSTGTTQIFELERLPQPNQVRYWAVVESENLVIMSNSPEATASIAGRLTDSEGVPD